MRIPSGVPGHRTLAELAQWAAGAFTVVRQSWNVEHRVDGTHGFQWTDIGFTAANFTGSGTMTWTPSNTDVQTYQYARVGDLVVLQWAIQTSDCSGGGTELRLALPSGLLSPAVRSPSTHWYVDAGGTGAVGRAVIVQDEAFVRLFKADLSNWTATTSDNTRTEGTLWYKVG